MGDLRYIDAGVDIDAGNRAVQMIKRAVSSTQKASTIGDLGRFAGAFAMPSGYREPILIASTDSVGTKVKIAIATGRHRGIGIDLVNHCVNDIATSGAEPMFFLDYFATGKLKPELLAEIVDGVAEACRDAGAALIGGETAEMPGVYALGDYDIAGFIVGVVDRANLIEESRVSAGDVLVGLPSSGLHTNGFSMVRYLFKEDKLNDPHPGLDRPLADELLEPHRSYLADLRLARGAVEVLGVAHITGGGLLENVPRCLPDGLGAEIESSTWALPRIFQLIASRGVRDEEMWRTFNMGIGMVLVVRPADAPELLRALDGSGAVEIGRVIKQRGPERVLIG
ncbi:MAG: phosphoribosylformylglycinamidine cyclo-ligase [Candidatus Dormibacteria bacterium]